MEDQGDMSEAGLMVAVITGVAEVEAIAAVLAGTQYGELATAAAVTVVAGTSEAAMVSGEIRQGQVEDGEMVVAVAAGTPLSATRISVGARPLHLMAAAVHRWVGVTPEVIIGASSPKVPGKGHRGPVVPLCSKVGISQLHRHQVGTILDGMALLMVGEVRFYLHEVLKKLKRIKTLSLQPTKDTQDLGNRRCHKIQLWVQVKRPAVPMVERWDLEECDRLKVAISQSQMYM